VEDAIGFDERPCPDAVRVRLAGLSRPKRRRKFLPRQEIAGSNVMQGRANAMRIYDRAGRRGKVEEVINAVECKANCVPCGNSILRSPIDRHRVAPCSLDLAGAGSSS